MIPELELRFALPGILSRGENFQILGFHADEIVVYDDFGLGSFDASAIVREIATMVRMELADGLSFLLTGALLGGMLIPFIVQEIRQQAPELSLERLRCVIIDAPFGVETMVAAARSPLAGYLIRSPFGHVLRPLASIKVGPRDEYIEVPGAATMREIAGEAMSAEDWREYVKQRARQELTGHSSRQWLEQLRWMTRVAWNGSLRRACRTMRGVETSYLACAGPANDVVVQPLARECWAACTPDLRMYEVDAAHCGFVQQAPTFRWMFAEIIG